MSKQTKNTHSAPSALSCLTHSATGQGPEHRTKYEYDSLGQVVSGKKYWSDQTPVAGQQFEYAFDDIGNRTGAKAGGNADGAGLRSASYTVNYLNQYNHRTVPSAVDVMGVSFATNTVLVNSQTAYRKGEYFRKELAVNNTAGPVQTSVSVAASGQTTVSGTLLLAPAQEQFAYDADGNLLQDGLWNYTWDGENRLVALESTNGLPESARLKLEFRYDYQGRRIEKIVSNWDAQSWTWVPQSTNRFVYDGWNLIAILDPQASILQSFVWGLDLSGSLQGAGGVGGLLFICHLPSAIGHCTPAYDGNGNVTALVSMSGGTNVAQYEYGPFGEVIRATGPMAKANPFRFSTEYYDDETDIIMYPHRPYGASQGRFLSRDPIIELGFKVITGRPRRPFYREEEKALYGFVRNDAIDRIDFLGLYTANVGKCEVVVLCGHGSSSRPHRFKFAACSAGHFVGCESKATNDRFLSDNQIPGAPSTDEELYSGPGNRDNPDQSFDLFMDQSWGAAKKKAKVICAKKDCCCKSVTVRTELAGSAWIPDNWTFPGTRSETIKCDGK